VLQDGTVYHGSSFGHVGVARGEVCFNTGMTGYQEVLTDPSYSGQIVTMTYPQVGNYGINPDDVESGRVQVAGFVVREGCDEPSNFRSTMSLPAWLDAQGIVGIQDIDTRALTRKLRSDGAMNGIIDSTGTRGGRTARRGPHPALDGRTGSRPRGHLRGGLCLAGRRG
jgi:carbamoyl-phosphate synthase small subunit